MKLIKLWIESYKNLNDFTIDFEQGNGLTMLIGTNGSGKSNILELISGIFADAYNQKSTVSSKYLLCYKLENETVYIANKLINQKYKQYVAISNPIKNHEGKVIIRSRNAPRITEFEIDFIDSISNKTQFVFEIGDTISFTLQNKSNINESLPSRVVAIYSGEELRLWEKYYEPNYNKYIKNINNNVASNKLSMTYINKYYWNIALLVMMLSDTEDIKNFISLNLNISVCNSIKINYDIAKLENCDNPLLKSFIERINPENQGELSYSFDEFKNLFYDNFVTADGEQVLTQDGDLFMVKSHTDFEKFNMFSQAYLPKNNKIIKNIEIFFNEGITVSTLSEGEKKRLLLRCILDIVADPNSLILMDEPDAHIHEGYKKIIYNEVKTYAEEFDRQVVLTTHSPTLAYDTNKHIILLDIDTQGHTYKISDETIDAVCKLTGDIWSSVGKNIFLTSDSMILLVEGKGDVEYINKAIDVLKHSNPEYNKLEFDIFPMGGADNARHFIEQIKPCIDPNRKVIVLFDRDEAGGSGIGKCIDKGNDRNHYNTYKQNNWYYLMLPKTAEHDFIDFVIEDYFTKDHKKATAQAILDEANGNFNKFRKTLRGDIKDKLSSGLKDYTHEDMQGFKVLLDKLLSIVENNEVVTEI